MDLCRGSRQPDQPFESIARAPTQELTLRGGVVRPRWRIERVKRPSVAGNTGIRAKRLALFAPRRPNLRLD